MKKICFFLGVLTCAFPLSAQQLYNMDFDVWSKSGGAWNLYAKDTPASRQIWDSANKGTAILGINGTTPEYKHVAVEGKGKAAVKIASRKAFGMFVAGNLYNGSYVRTVNMSGAEMYHGVPFSGRPRSLSGYCHYLPGTIDYAKAPYEHLKGKLDYGHIDIILTDWEGPLHVDTTEGKVYNPVTDPHVIGSAVLDLREDTGGYIHFEILINYKDARKPGYVVITAASSALGAYFTGSSKSVMYVDEFRFNY